MHLYKEVVHLLKSEEEWPNECKGFIGNYEFPCVEAWNGFHIHVATRLKNYYSFKSKYTVTSMGLLGYNKQFLHLTKGAPGSTHEAHLLMNTSLFKEIENGRGIPNKSISREDSVLIPIFTVGYSAFLQLQWFINGYNENTHDQKNVILIKTFSWKMRTICSRGDGTFSKKTLVSNEKY